MDARHISLALGRSGEEAAADYLQSLGWRIVERNFRTGSGEIDLIADDGRTVVFVEVKTRSSIQHGLPAEAVGPQKAQRLLRAAARYLSQTEQWHRPCRFDIIAIVGRPPQCTLYHLRHTVELSHALDRRHAHWQPW